MTMKQFLLKNEIKLSKGSTIIIFLALVRTISEPFRLQYYSEISLTFEQIKPFLIASLITAIALFAMTVFSYYNNHKLIITFAIITIVIMLIVKKIYIL
jgi:hypothetical protein